MDVTFRISNEPLNLVTKEDQIIYLKQLRKAIDTLSTHDIKMCLTELYNNIKLYTKQDSNRILYLIKLLHLYFQEKKWCFNLIIDEEILLTVNNKTNEHSKLLPFTIDSISKRIIIYKESLAQTDNKIIQKVIYIVRKNIPNNISLKEVADIIYVNYSYLSRIFKQEIGITFKEYVTRQKMILAKELLKKGEKISRIAEHLSYNDSSYFTKVFRRYWKITPQQMLLIIKDTENISFLSLE